MRDKLSEIAAVLGQGNAEIFPKQEKLLMKEAMSETLSAFPIMMSNALSVPRSQTRKGGDSTAVSGNGGEVA